MNLEKYQMKGYIYILKCANGEYYTGSTNDLDRRMEQHRIGEGANFTRKHWPCQLVYCEEYHRVQDAFYREKQIQKWSRKKKEALINGDFNRLIELSKNYTQYLNGQLRNPGDPTSTPSPWTSSGSGIDKS
jgi:putative endonuclease